MNVTTSPRRWRDSNVTPSTCATYSSRDPRNNPRGVVILLYLDRACDTAQAEGRLTTLARFRGAGFDGAPSPAGRALSATTALGLLPLMWSTGAGADVMKRIVAPMVGGVATTAVVVLLVFPAVTASRAAGTGGLGLLSRQAGATLHAGGVPGCSPRPAGQEFAPPGRRLDDAAPSPRWPSTRHRPRPSVRF